MEATAVSPERSGTITVSGTARVWTRPDVADVRLGVAVARPTARQARQDAAVTMDRILQAVGAAGVAGVDVRTTILAIQPRYDYAEGGSPTLAGYELSNVVLVTVRDLGRLSDVVDGALGAGATSMDGLVFRVEDPAPAEREARLLAMQAARGRADVLAEAAGLQIVGVSDVAEERTWRRPDQGPRPSG